MEYFEIVAEHGGLHAYCPPPLKKREDKKHFEMMMKEEKAEGDQDQSHWWTFVQTMSDGNVHATSHDLLLKVLSFANKLNCDRLMRLCSMRTVDIIYESTPQEARDFLGFKNSFTPEEEAKAMKDHPWPHKQA
jgi:hypothetical protein